MSERLTVGRFSGAYREGLSPVAVTEQCFDAVADGDRADPPLRALISTCRGSALEHAELSEKRHAAGQPLSPLDGVPVVVKDNLDLAGAATTNGTRLSFPVAMDDAPCVARLRASGAVIIGKANLHEIGAGVTGINPHHGTPRNPYDPKRWCGGSSSGSACAVGAGIVPLAIGTDAGGSIRNPASFVGAVGLKPTFGRISRLGLSILCDTLDHIGPIAGTCRDALFGMWLMSEVRRDDPETWDQPPLPDLSAALAAFDEPTEELRVGVVRALIDGPWTDPAVARHVHNAVAALKESGAVLVDVTIPDVELCRSIGMVLLGAEGPSGLEAFLDENHDLLGADLQVLLAVGQHISARDYLHAQRLRKRVQNTWRQLLRTVDVVILPSAGQVAGTIKNDAVATGEIDERETARIVSSAFPANLTGFPALSVPAGFHQGMPVGVQLVAGPWRELELLRAGRWIEDSGLCPYRRPPIYFGDRFF